MSVDISDILDEWPYRPGEINVRKIVGADGHEKIQLRLDLGMLQMAATGRPDGQRPHGKDSDLEYYEELLAQHHQEQGTTEGFELDEEACDALRSEGVLYYHRYLAAFVLGDYDCVLEDTEHNLRLFDFCLAHATDDHDRVVLEQYRPYVLMMRTRARAKAAMARSRPQRALEAVHEGVREIEAAYDRLGQDVSQRGAELAVLEALTAEIEAEIPVDPATRLRDELSKAVAEERYEDAAALRDRLREATGPETASA